MIPSSYKFTSYYLVKSLCLFIYLIVSGRVHVYLRVLANVINEES